jgi:hypothetical protein
MVYSQEKLAQLTGMHQRIPTHFSGTGYRYSKYAFVTPMVNFGVNPIPSTTAYRDACSTL